MKWIFSLLLLASCCCSDKKAPPSTLRLNVQNNPYSLDPRVGGDRRTQIFIRLLFEGLTRLGEKGAIEPGLATDWEVSEDGLTYTFFLRESLWSNGDSVTAHDFEYGWKALLAPNFDCLFAELLYPIRNAQAAKEGRVSKEMVGVTAIDNLTLQVELEHPTPYFLELTSNGVFSPINRSTEIGWSRKIETYIGNGPFTLKVWDHDREIVLEKNPLYWDANSVEMDSIVFSMVSDSGTAMRMFEIGEIDWMGEPFSGMPTGAFIPLSREGRLQSQPVGGIARYTFDVETTPFQSAKVRRAFAYAVDRQLLIDHVLGGGESVATSLVPPYLSGYQDKNLLQFDLEKAQMLFTEGLADLGIDREDIPPIRLHYPTSGSHKEIAQVVQQQWQEAFDIPVVIEGVDLYTFISRYADRELQIGGITFFSIVNDPVYTLERLKSRDDWANPTHWNDPNYTALIDEANRKTDSKEREQLLTQAEALIMEAMPVCPLYMTNYKHMKREELEGVVISGSGYCDLKRARWATPRPKA